MHSRSGPINGKKQETKVNDALGCAVGENCMYKSNAVDGGVESICSFPFFAGVLPPDDWSAKLAESF